MPHALPELDEAGEVVVALTNGWTLRSADEIHLAGEYVRLCRPDGEEHLYWDHHEWGNDPIGVMGAILCAAAGGERVERVGECFRCGLPVTEQVEVIAVDAQGRNDCPESEDGMPHEIDPPDGWDN